MLAMYARTRVCYNIVRGSQWLELPVQTVKRLSEPRPGLTGISGISMSYQNPRVNHPKNYQLASSAIKKATAGAMNKVRRTGKFGISAMSAKSA